MGRKFAVFLLLAVTACPLICSTWAASDYSEQSSSNDNNNNNEPQNHHHHHQYQQHRRRHRQHVPGTDHGELQPNNADSYITKQAAQELQEKVRQLHHPVTDAEYNALLQMYVSKPKSDPSHPIYDKKYYDYLKSEAAVKDKEAGVDKEVIDLSAMTKNKRKKPFKKAHPAYVLRHGDRIEVEQQQQQQKNNNQEEEHQGERRAKRSATVDDGHEIGKRQTGVWTNQYQRHDTRRTFVAPQPYVTVAAADHDYDEDQSSSLTNIRQNNNRGEFYRNWAPAASAPLYQRNTFPSASFNSLWAQHRFPDASTPFLRPHNYYLPVAPPPDYHQYIVRPPYQPWMSFPVPGVVYNPAFPPKNPPPSVVRPDTNSISGGDRDDKNDLGPATDLPTRFGADDEEDRFIFDVEYRTQAPPQRQPSRPEQPRFPTRRPPPPLIRDSDNEDTDAAINNIFGLNRPVTNTNSNGNINNNRQPVNSQQRPRATTRRPPPPLIHNSDDDDSSSLGQSTNQFGNTNSQPQRPQFTNPTRAPTTSTPRPQWQQQRPRPADERPSECVWAIVNCCQPRRPEVRYSCFERLGCGGAFWGINPCDQEIFDSAVDVADKFSE